MEKMYTAQETADLLRASYQVVMRWCRDGKVKAHKRGSVWLISESEIKRLRGEF